jgi:chitodextrinase
MRPLWTNSAASAPMSSDGVDFYSRQTGNVALRPELVVETVEGGAPQSASPPTVSGGPREGQTLTATHGTWTGTEPIAHQFGWERCLPPGTGCTPIAGAGAETYELRPEDVGSTVRAVVTATNAAGSASATSAVTGLVLAARSGDPVVAAAGDIADCTVEDDEGTAALLDALQPTRVLALGDSVYQSGTDAEFAGCYDPTWGRHKAITSPIVGNHEYKTPAASGYFNYFGPAAGDPQKGYYAFDLGAWRLYALNSNCEIVSCSSGSAQEQWLRADLAANPRSCLLAYAHHPRFASRTDSSRDNASLASLYKAFFEAAGDIWLTAHDHNYERLTRLDPAGAIDLADGARHFIVGTGGTHLDPFGVPVTGSELRERNTHGVIKLTLRSAGYDWQFLPEAGGSFADGGSDTCAEAVPDTIAPSAPANLEASPAGAAQVDLAWTAASDTVGVVGYEIIRDGVPLATTTATTLADTSVTPGTTYSYTVRARDAAANLSAPSNTATATPGATQTTSTFQPVADARVQEATPDTNYGTASTLRVNLSPGAQVESLLRFTVTGMPAPVRSARLRLYATTGTVDGPAVHAASGTWTETGVTWSNRPAPAGAAVADAAAVGAASWLELDVTPLVTGNGTFDFLVAPTSKDGADFYSRQTGHTTLRPELVVVAG